MIAPITPTLGTLPIPTLEKAEGQGFTEALRRAESPALIVVPQPTSAQPLEVRREDLSPTARREFERLESAAAQLEGLLVRQLLKEMDRVSPIGGQGPMRDLAVDAFQTAIAGSAVRGVGFGVAKSIVRQASRPILMQEAARLILAKTQPAGQPGDATKVPPIASPRVGQPMMEDRKVER